MEGQCHYFSSPSRAVLPPASRACDHLPSARIDAVRILDIVGLIGCIADRLGDFDHMRCGDLEES